MRLIRPSVELLEQNPGLQGIYDMIELCGKTSYKSPVKGGKVAEDFVSARVNEGHYAVLEFGTVYLKYPSEKDFIKYHENPYSSIHLVEDGDFAVTTNLRVLVENGWTSDLEYLCEPTEHHARRYTARVITDRGVTHEIVRHRTFSFCQESTRYCNYSKDKFGKGLTFIEPQIFDSAKADSDKRPLTAGEALFIKSCREAEENYMEFLGRGFTPQQARAVLPNSVKTEICMCGFRDTWEHFFELRYYGATGKPHPDMLQVSTMLYNAFKERGIDF